jgi:glutamate-ammonia-ligase adenylyltransferase
LKIAGRLGLAPEHAALAAHDAYRRFRQLQHSVRLQGEQYARIEPGTVRKDVDAVRALWRAVFDDEALKAQMQLQSRAASQK